MKKSGMLLSMVKADFLERTRQSGFLITLCLIIYLGYAVNVGQILVKLENYRGIYNSAWVGGLMSLVITFFLGIAGFYLVKNSINRDERTGVGQIIATTPTSKAKYLLGKWLSNLAVLSALVGILALAALFMQLIQSESEQIQIWTLISPFLLIALPMMSMVAAFAVLFESISWLRGGFGNLVYMVLFLAIFTAGILLNQYPWLDMTGTNLIGTSMKDAVKAIDPAYSGDFVLAMISDQALQTFVWSGVQWSGLLVLQRLLWVVVSIGLVLAGVPFFKRFNPYQRFSKNKKSLTDAPDEAVEKIIRAENRTEVRLSTLPGPRLFKANFLNLIWLEFLLLVKGIKWYWLAGAAALWIGCLTASNEGIRKFWYMVVSLLPVLVYAQMGQRDARYHTEQLINQAAFAKVRSFAASWIAGIFLALITSCCILISRLLYGDPMMFVQWGLAVLFVPTLALTLGVWSRSSKLFEVVYPILWYLGPFNKENGLAILDYLGIHEMAYSNTKPLWVFAFTLVLICVAYLGKMRKTEL